MRAFFVLLLSFIFFVSSPAKEKGPVDSLLKVLSTAGQDTNRVNTLNDLASEFATKYPDSSLAFAKSALALSEKITFQAGIAASHLNIGQIDYNRSDLDNALDHYSKALAIWIELSSHYKKAIPRSISDQWARTLGNLGNIYSVRSDYPKALEYFNKALVMDKASGNKKGVARHLGNIGIVYKKRGDLPKALNYYLEALKMHEEMQSKSGMAIWMGNIGILYTSLDDTAKARKYLCDALKMDEELGNKIGVERHLGNLGILYYKQNRFKEALENYNKALLIAQEIKDKNFVGMQLGNIGVAYYDRGDYPAALDHYLQALAIDKELGNKNYTAAMLGNIGALYMRMKRYGDAKRYLDDALALSHDLNTLEYSSEFERNYSELDSSLGNFSGALEHYKKYVSARDSINNDANTKRTVQLQMQYDFEKQQTADSIRNAEQVKQEELKHEQEIRQQRIYTYGGVLGFLLMLIVAGVSFNAFRQKQKANDIITKQKELVEEKQKEILDSIHYAKRIQRSLLPNEKFIDRTITRLKGP